MNIKSLLLGSIAAAGLATGAHAADLQKGVMTSLDVCDALGLSGLTISSDKDCLQITGSVSYQFVWGDYGVGAGSANSGLRIVQTPDDNSSIPISGDSAGTDGNFTDWDSQVIAWLQAVASSDSDFGVAKAVIKIKSEQYRHNYNGYGYFDGDDTGGSTTNTGGPSYESAQQGPSGTVLFDRAYVSVGDSTVLTAGKTGTIANTGDDTPLDWLGLFNSDNVGTGVLWSVNNRAGGDAYTASGDGYVTDTAGADIQTGGHSIQLVSTLGNGITVGGSLEDLQDTQPGRAGTAVGVISYAGDNLTAHLTVLEAGILDGHPDVGAYHAGFTGTFDKFKLVGAIAGDSTGYWNGLASAELSLDMFKLAAAVEATHNSDDAPGSDSNGDAYAGANGFGAGASASVTVSDGVSLNIGGRYFDSNTATADNEGYQGQIGLVAAITETLSVEGDLGVYGTNSGGIVATSDNPGTVGDYYNVYYGAAQVSWAPGGGFTSSLKGEAYSDGGYKATFKAAKAFQ